MFVLNPDPYSLPAYRIGPFCTRDLSINHGLPRNDLIEDYLGERFGNKHYQFTYNGRKAINTALGYYNLKADDVVTILTTSGNFYISSCVTNEIEKFCKWSRKILPETKVIFVNHEFGFPYPDMKSVRNLNLPIIEDCAGSFFSSDIQDSIGKTGDFVIYSFPKMFPIQIGGLLVSHKDRKDINTAELEPGMVRYIKNVLSEYIRGRDNIILKRISNYKALRSMFITLGLPERFVLSDGVVPGVFMFGTGNHSIKLPELKKHFWAHGIQSSVFYGDEAYFIPVHQALTAQDLEYFHEVMKAFLQKNAR